MLKELILDSYASVTNFHMSPEEDTMYAESGIDIFVLAGLFNINIWIFQYNREDGSPPGWAPMTPLQPELRFVCEYINFALLDVALYNCDSSPHFDLLVAPDSLLALEEMSTNCIVTLFGKV